MHEHEEEMYCSFVRCGGVYVTLNPPLLRMMDDQGVMLGGVNAAASFVSRATQKLAARGVSYRWAFFAGGYLQTAVDAVNAGVSVPVVKHILPYTQASLGHTLTEHGEGKVILTFDQE